MQIVRDVYQLSGVPMRTNSNSYVIDTGSGLVMIDAGFSGLQWDKMMEMMEFWNINHLPITHVFFTHCHLDHAGNAWRAKERGALLFAGPSDAEGIENGDQRCIGYMFGQEMKPCKIDGSVEDLQDFRIGSLQMRAYHMPGHSRGSMIYEAVLNGKTLLFTGDFLALEPAAPEDDVRVNLAWTGGPDFSGQDYLASLKRASSMKADILCPGHYYVFYGECSRILQMAYEKGKKDL